MSLALCWLLVGAAGPSAPPPPLGKPTDITFNRSSPVRGPDPCYVFEVPVAPGDRLRIETEPKGDPPVLTEVEVFDGTDPTAGRPLETSGQPGRVVTLTMQKPATGNRLTVRVSGRSYGTVQLTVTKLGGPDPVGDPAARVAALEQQVRDLRKELEQVRAVVAELTAAVKKLTEAAKEQGKGKDK